jgi:hypothetical protein
MNKSPPKPKHHHRVSGHNVLDRLRVSQKMIEQRELKLRKNIVPQILNADDGDHGIKQGYVKRKG